MEQQLKEEIELYICISIHVINGKLTSKGKRPKLMAARLLTRKQETTHMKKSSLFYSFRIIITFYKRKRKGTYIKEQEKETFKKMKVASVIEE